MSKEVRKTWITVQTEYESIPEACEDIERNGYEVKFIIEGQIYARIIARRSFSKKEKPPVALPEPSIQKEDVLVASEEFVLSKKVRSKKI